jgi:DNA ligase-1
LDATTSTNAKIDALARYFAIATPADAAWAVYFLCGGRPRQTVPTKILRTTAIACARLPEWLFEECYQAVGDLAETIALVLPAPSRLSEFGLAYWIEERLLNLRGADPESVSLALSGYWDELDAPGRFLLTKLIGGAFRVGVSKLLVTRALAQLGQIDSKLVAQRLMGYTDMRRSPTADAYRLLLAPETQACGEGVSREVLEGQPYPYFLAHPLGLPLEQLAAQLGPPDDWVIEWKYDGIRGQLVQRGNRSWLWTRGEELVNERYPELMTIGARLPEGTVLDGEILVWIDEKPGSFALLQQRIGRKTLSAKLLREAPVSFLAFDLLERQGEDQRERTQALRRTDLEGVVNEAAHPRLRISPLVSGATWEDLDVLRASARARGVEGFMLKSKSARYGVGRTKEGGVWWKWKLDPFTVDAVLVYAQRGHGRRASLYTDFTFAVWDQPPGVAQRSLVPFAKAYSGLTDEEMREVDAIVRKTTVEKFGPVRSVEPTLVFELGFEGIQRSSRHKSGIAVRFPRMLRRRVDKTIGDADTLATLEALLA